MGDEECRDDIPPLSAGDDPDLDRTLVSSADFERRQAEAAGRRGRGNGTAADGTAASDAQGAAPPEVDGTPVPALADGDAVEAIGDAPIGDSELAAPLPPLGSFNVEPVQFAEPEDEGRNRTIQYSLQVNGLDAARSEEHTSELQSLMRISYAVFCLKKKK